jgi:hypothetical protein
MKVQIRAHEYGFSESLSGNWTLQLRHFLTINKMFSIAIFGLWTVNFVIM